MFSIQNNVGRGNSFVAFAKIVAIANSILDKGWLPTSTIILDSRSERKPITTVSNKLVELINEVPAKSDGSEPSFKVGEKTYKRSALVEAFSLDMSQTAETEDMGHEVAIGNSRALALVLLWSLGHEVVDYKIIEQEVSSELAIADNEANALATKLDAMQRLQSAITLYHEGKVGKEADLNKVYKRGVAQALWVQLQAVVIHGLDPSEAVKLKATSATREAVKLAKGAAKALKATLSEPEAPSYKTIPGKTLAEWAKTMPEWAELLTALAHGQEVTARLFLSGNSPTVNE